MLKYVSKFAMDILPSVVATIIGAYIVNHYIVTKPGADTPRSPPRCRRPTRRRPSQERCEAARGLRRCRQHPRAGRQGEGHLREGPCSRRRRPKGRRSSRNRPKNPPTSRPRPRASRSRPVVTSRGPREKAIAKIRRGAASACDAGRGCRARRRRAEYRPAGRGRERSGRASRRQRSGACGDRAAAGRRRRFVACAGSRPRPGCAPYRIGPSGGCAGRVDARGSAAAAPDHGLHARRRDVQSANGLVAGQARLSAAAGIDDSSRPTPPADIPEVSASLPSPGPLDLRAEAVEPQRREHTNVAEDMLSGGEVGVSRGIAEIGLRTRS